MMTNEEKMYKLLLNLLDLKPQVRLSYDDEEERYRVSGLECDLLKCRVNVHIYRFPIWDLAKSVSIGVYDQNGRHAFTFGTENLDEVIDVFRGSYIDGLLEGIEL